MSEEGANLFDLEYLLEVMDDRIVQTSKGPYISVENLKQLAEEFKEAKQERDSTAPGLRTMRQARRAAMEDPEILAAFADQPMRAPADAGVVKPVAEEKQDEAA